MSISQRFFYNYFDVVEAGNEFKIGDHKHELTDTQLGRICRLTGGHQRSLSLNRCMRLTDVGFKDMSLLTAIWYLDLSYTKCADVSPLASCKYLKSLNLSGLHLSDYIALSLLPSLEVLSLSFGSISTTVPLSHLTKLRSLNLGFTKVQDISGVEPCTRLEELLLDCTQISSAAEVGRVVQQLPQLRLLGVGNTPCAQEKKALQLALPHGAVLHTLTSSYYWFKAIMDNDAARVRELMTFGYDINARASTEDLGPLMLQTWSQRCSGATIFFDVFHPEEALRPKALHLAIFFSSVDALKLLINAGVDFGGDVWIGSVAADPLRPDPVSGRLIQNDRKQRANNSEAKSAFLGSGKKNAITFCKKIFDCNIHRFTEGMQKKRIRSWKDLCEQHMKRMICLINDEQDPGVPISREDRRLMEKGLSSEAFLLAQQSSFELNAAMMGETPFPVSYDQLDNEISPQSPVREESADMFDGLETQNLNELPGAPRGQVSDMTAHWNSNALVGRLHVPVRIPDSRGTLPMMGPRSYFEESYAQTVRQNVRADDILREKLEAQEEEIRLNPQLAEEKSAQALLASKTAASLTDLSGKDKGSVYYTPAGKEQLHALRPDDMKRTIRERKELFYRLINKKTGQFVDEESETETGGPTERV